MSGVMAQPASELAPPAAGLSVRVASAALLALPTLLAVYLGTPVFEAFVAVGGLLLAWEWCRLCRDGRPAAADAVVIAAVPAAVATAAAGGFAAGAAVVGLGAAASAALARGRLWLPAGAVYAGAACLALVWLRADSAAGRETVFWLLAVVWASDVGGLAAGRLIGGPRLAPRLSPNKTWAGLAGAALAAAAAGAVTAAVLGKGVLPLAAVSGGLGVAGQAGDLFESSVKRRFGVKDSGGWIPGHGGLLDRVDALIAVVLVSALIGVIGGGSMLAWL